MKHVASGLKQLKAHSYCSLNQTDYKYMLLNFVFNFQGSLYFGVEKLLSKCKTWFFEATSLKGLLQIELDDLIHIWNFGLEHGKV